MIKIKKQIADLKKVPFYCEIKELSELKEVKVEKKKEIKND